MLNKIIINFDQEMSKNEDLISPPTNTLIRCTSNTNPSEMEKNKDETGKEYEQFIKREFDHMKNDYNIMDEDSIIITNKDIDGNKSLFKEYTDLYSFILNLSDEIICK